LSETVTFYSIPQHLSSPSAFSGVRVGHSSVVCILFCSS